MKMIANMNWEIGAMSLMLVWLCAGYCCMAQSTPRSVVTRDYFYNRIMNGVPDSCRGKTFYRYHGFITAAEQSPGFGTTGSEVVRRREVAAFLANVMHETGGLCYIRERNPQTSYCDPKFTQWPCTPGKRYFGRGPLQLTWNYNYGAAGKAIGFNGLNNPEIVGQDALISFKTAYWFWMNNCHDAIVSGKGFGATIRAINSGECNGGNSGQVNSRVQYYRRFCGDFGVDPGPNIYC